MDVDISELSSASVWMAGSFALATTTLYVAVMLLRLSIKANLTVSLLAGMGFSIVLMIPGMLKLIRIFQELAKLDRKFLIGRVGLLAIIPGLVMTIPYLSVIAVSLNPSLFLSVVNFLEVVKFLYSVGISLLSIGGALFGVSVFKLHSLGVSGHVKVAGVIMVLASIMNWFLGAAGLMITGVMMVISFSLLYLASRS